MDFIKYIDCGGGADDVECVKDEESSLETLCVW